MTAALLRTQQRWLIGLAVGGGVLATNVAGMVGDATVLAQVTQSPPETVAIVNGHTILRTDVERGIADTLGRLEEQAYKLRRQEIERLIDEYLLESEAIRRGLNLKQLLGEEKEDKLAPRSERVKRRELIASLRKAAAIEVRLSPPIVRRVEVGTEGAAFRGPVTAPVTIVQFADYYCRFCHKAARALKELEEQFRDRVRIVHRHLPIDALHPHARAAAEAAWCAQQQGRFPQFNDALLQDPSEELPYDLASVAKRAHLDLTAFDVCRSSVESKNAVQNDIDEAKSLGIAGTPAFFVNGRRVIGAVPVDVLARIVDEEFRTAASTR
jgi:protein-disulfide isomerase